MHFQERGTIRVIRWKQHVECHAKGESEAEDSDHTSADGSTGVSTGDGWETSEGEDDCCSMSSKLLAAITCGTCTLIIHVLSIALIGT